MPLPRRTIRLRLTLVYGALFLVSGAALLTVSYLLVRYTFPVVSTRTHLVGRPPVGDARPPAPLSGLAALQPPAARQRDADLHQLLVVSGVALAGMAPRCCWAGWLPGGSCGHCGRSRPRLAACRRPRWTAASTAASLRGTCARLLAAAIEQERLIEALLTLATSEREIERWEPFDLAELAEVVLDARRGDAERAGLRLAAELEPAPASGDPDLVERLLANLVDNALRYNTPGGQIEIATGTKEGRSTVTVVNSGPVVPADQIAGLFEPFRRLVAGRSRRAGGHGLGLSIVAVIATGHHARLLARPGANGGLIVSAAFPGVWRRAGERICHVATSWS